jgi:nicotinate-nucleotide pyrophosphorylase (carboxylating)
MTLGLALTQPPHALLVEPIVRAALWEDLGRAGDITSDLTIPAEKQARAQLVARKRGTVSGLIAAERAFHLIDPAIEFVVEQPDGSGAQAGNVLAAISGPARAILTAERVSLNFVSHLSGIATATRALVDAVKEMKARIVDTRKTTPGLRLLEKYAVRCGGGFNHRFGLDDAVLIKDNHIAVAGSITAAVRRVRAGVAHMVKIEVEVDTLAQFEEALSLGVDAVLLDNMGVDDLRRAVSMGRGRIVLEASGNIDAASARAVAETGVDYISVGAVTHSAPSLDVGLDL